MKHLIIIFTLFLASCGAGEQAVTGSVGINVQDNFTQCQIRQETGVMFIRQSGGLDPFAMALDGTFSGVVYPAGEWTNLTIADGMRVNLLNATEQAIIDGTL